MPLLYTSVTEIGTYVVDPVVDQAIEWMHSRLGTKDIVNVNTRVINDRTATSLISDEDDNPNMVNDSLQVTVETHFSPTNQHWEDHPDYNTPSAGTARRYSHMYQPLFSDPEVGFHIREMTASFGLTLSFRFEFITYDVAEQVLRSLYAQDLGGQVNHLQDIVISYPLTLGVLKALYLVHQNRAGWKDKPLWDYFANFCTSDYQVNARREDLITPERATRPETMIAWKRIQMNCIGKINIDQDKPEPIVEGQAPTSYAVEFQYLLQFGRPDLLQIDLPIMVSNIPLPDKIFANLPRTI